MVESSLGIVGACLPLMRPVFMGCSSQGFVRKLRSFSYFSSLHSKPSNEQVEFATRTSDADSATTIAHIIPPKISFSGSAAKWYDPDHGNQENASLLTLLPVENTVTCVIQTYSTLRNRLGSPRRDQIHLRRKGYIKRGAYKSEAYLSVSTFSEYESIVASVLHLEKKVLEEMR